MQVLSSYGVISGVRLIRDKATGESRRFAFADFHTVEEAHSFMEYNSGALDIDGRRVFLEYSKHKENIAQGSEHKDWLCSDVSSNPTSLTSV